MDQVTEQTNNEQIYHVIVIHIHQIQYKTQMRIKINNKYHKNV